MKDPLYEPALQIVVAKLFRLRCSGAESGSKFLCSRAAGMYSISLSVTGGTLRKRFGKQRGKTLENHSKIESYAVKWNPP
jgi:hypothetical protein